MVPPICWPPSRELVGMPAPKPSPAPPRIEPAPLSSPPDIEVRPDEVTPPPVRNPPAPVIGALKMEPSPAEAAALPPTLPNRPRLLRLLRPFMLPMSEPAPPLPDDRSEEHMSELQSLMRISYSVFCLKKKKKQQ